MRILFIAMPESIHTARWINQLSDTGWDIHIFASDEAPVNAALQVGTVHGISGIRTAGLSDRVKVKGIWPFKGGQRELCSVANKWPYFLQVREKQLMKMIKRLKPDIIHSLEFQHSAYLTLDARNNIASNFPPWIVTNWGSDIYLFGRLKEHAERIKAVLAACTHYSCECQRDVVLGKAFGFTGEVLPVLPNTGGFDLEQIQSLRESGLTSARRVIALKGYQGWAGRALVGLRALALCADVLKDYSVVIYSAAPEVEIAAELLQYSTGISVTIMAKTSHEELLRLHGRARISLGLSISDAISISFLEALVMGSFPIQSNTSCAGEWIVDGETGILVPPDDPQIIATAIRRALTDDALVDAAAFANAQTASTRLDNRDIVPKVIAIYRQIIDREKLK